MKRLILTMMLCWINTASAFAPGSWIKGRCLTFALAYCLDHYGCELVVVTYPVGNNKLNAHILVYDHGRILDNMHPMGVEAKGNDVIVWLYQLGEQNWGISVFRVIQYNQQSVEDARVITYLRGTEQ